jgi:hypothetical protein
MFSFLLQNATPMGSLVPGLETANSDKVSAGAKSQEDIMSVLLAHEKRSSSAAAVKAVIPGQNDSASESSADEDLRELDASEPGAFLSSLRISNQNLYTFLLPQIISLSFV